MAYSALSQLALLVLLLTAVGCRYRHHNLTDGAVP